MLLSIYKDIEVDFIITHQAIADKSEKAMDTDTKERGHGKRARQSNAKQSNGSKHGSKQASKQSIGKQTKS